MTRESNRSLQGCLYGSWRNRNQPGGLRIAAAVEAGEAALGAALKTRLSASIFGALSNDREMPSSGDAIDHALRLQLIMKF